MKILQICSKPPYPAIDGGCIAMNNLTNGLIENGCDVKVLAINTPKHQVKKSELPIDYLDKTKIEFVFIDTSIKPLNAVLNLFQSKSYNIARFYSLDFKNKLIQLLTNQSFDIIHLEGLFVTPYLDVIRKYSSAKVVLRAHNIEHKIWERLANEEKKILKKWYLRLLAKRLKQYELSIINKVDAVTTITLVDEKEIITLGCNKPVFTTPFGIDLKAFSKASNKNVDKNTLFHLGSMDWMPNTEGVKWFLENVWNNVHKLMPQVKLYLAGRNMPKSISSLNLKNVVVSNEVLTPIDFMQSKNIMIVPLFSGGGMRVKIIEGMALGKTIISTTIGAEGINCENNLNILIADNPVEFTNAITKCLTDDAFCETIANNGNKLVETYYNNSQICKQLVHFYQMLTETNKH